MDGEKQPQRTSDATESSVEGTVDSWMTAALDAMAAGDPATAVCWFECVIAAEAENSEAMHGLVRALEDAGRTDEALLLVHRLIAHDPEDVLALTRLSMIYQHQGMIAEAEAAATRAKLLGWKLELRAGSSPRTTL